MTAERRRELFTRTGRARYNSVECWRGPSRIDGAPILVIATGFRVPSNNSKTGAMVQSYIIRRDVPPLEAIRRGLDAAVCGGCRLRPQSFDGRRWKRRGCYVRVDLAPRGLFLAWTRGSIPQVSLAELSELTTDRMVRLGAYGDPGAAPLEVWHAYTARASGWTGYTHQASNPKLRDVLRYCQVSADGPLDAHAAHAAGTGSFRVLAAGEVPLPFEERCPASAEMGRVTTCAQCLKCSGSEGAHIAIEAHGGGARQILPSRRRGVSLPLLVAGR